MLVTVTESLPVGRVLDVGCGGGHDSIWLAQQGWSVFAIDTSRHAVTTVRKLAAEASLDLTAERLDATSLTFSSEFDLVSICYIHFAQDDLEQMLSGAVSALKGGGTLLIRSFEAGIEEAPFDRKLLAARNVVVNALSAHMLIERANVADEYFPYMKKKMRLLTVIATRPEHSSADRFTGQIR